MNEKHAPTTESDASQPPVVTAPSYRLAVFLAFLACFLCLLLVVSSWFAALAMSSGFRVLLGLFGPIVAATAVLYPSPIFRDRHPALRMAMLTGFGFVLLVLAFALLAALSFVLFGLGIIGLD